MITLHTFPGRPTLESMSPFCMKVEVYLKLMKIPYEAKTDNPLGSPKGKLPYITTADGARIADSTTILEHLEAQNDAPIDAGMTDGEKARARIIQRMLEEGFYFVLLWTRWVDDAGWSVVKSSFEAIPPPLRWAVLPFARRRVTSSLRAQGTGRHSRDEIYAIGNRDIGAIATVLGNGPFLLGERMRTVDLSAYSFFANVLRFDVDNPLKDAARRHPNIVAYVDRLARKLDVAG